MATAFEQQQGRGLTELEARIANTQAKYAHEQSILTTLKRMIQENPGIVRIGEQWRVDIPPTHIEHFDGDAILAPYGGVYFDTLSEAAAFMDRVLNEIAGGI